MNGEDMLLLVTLVSLLLFFVARLSMCYGSEDGDETEEDAELLGYLKSREITKA